MSRINPKYLSIVPFSLSFIFFAYHYLFYFPEYQIPTYSYDIPKISESEKVTTEIETPLSVLPDDILKINKITKLTNHDRTKILLYGTNFYDTEKDISEISKDINSSGLSYLITSQSLDIYFHKRYSDAIENVINVTQMDFRLKMILSNLKTQLTLLKLSSDKETDKRIDELINKLSSNTALIDQDYKKFVTEMKDELTGADIDLIGKTIKKTNQLDTLLNINKNNYILDIPQLFVSDNANSENVLYTSYLSNNGSTKQTITQDFYNNNNIEIYNHYEFSSEDIQDLGYEIKTFYIEPNIDLVEYQYTLINEKIKGLDEIGLNIDELTTIKRVYEKIKNCLIKQENNEEFTEEDSDFLSSLVNDILAIYSQLSIDKTSLKLVSIPYLQNEEIKTSIAPILIKDSCSTCQVESVKDIVISDDNYDEPYDYKPTTQSNYSSRIPIFMYHQIAKVPSSGSSFSKGLYVDPDMFEKHMAYLSSHNYKTVSSEEFYKIIKSGKNPSQKTVMLTFDDGIPNHYTTAYPILKKYGFTGVFYVVTNRLGIYHNQLKEMSDNGMDIESHSATHIDLKKEDNIAKLSTEIAGSKAVIQSITGKQVTAIAYPGCVADGQAFSVVAGSGYKLGLSCGRPVDHYFSGRYSLSRAHASNDMESFIKILSGIY